MVKLEPCSSRPIVRLVDPSRLCVKLESRIRPVDSIPCAVMPHDFLDDFY
jgi:hypothetical protein